MASVRTNIAIGAMRRPSIPLLGLAAAFVAVALLAFLWLGVPVGEFRDLVIFLSISAIASTALGVTAYRWSEAGRRSIRTKIVLAYGIGVTIVIVNILVTAKLMFISSHDLGLLVVLMVFGAIFSISFGAAVADRMTAAVARMAEGARAVSRGDMSARVQAVTNDELADLAASFNEMVENVTLATDRQKLADESRRELVAAVSHDLRTPLAAIQAMLEALDDGLVPDDETVRRYHATMRTQVTHLSRLIDDLFELSHIEARTMPFDRVSIDLGTLVETAIEGAAMTAIGRGVSLQFQSEGPIRVSVDPTRIARVISNLVDNAVRHSPDGSSIRVWAGQQEDDVVVFVDDHGTGIAAEDLERIFTRFYRVESSRSRFHGGAGLGLAIARGIVEGHGGKIWAENLVSGGARFTFTLPAG